MIFTDGPSDRPRKGRRIQDGPDRLAKLRAYWNAELGTAAGTRPA